MKNVFWYLAVAAVFFTGCDMTHINKDSEAAQRSAAEAGADEPGMTEEEMLLLEKEGHFLKVINMPVNTQTRNVQAAGVYNSAHEIGKMDAKNAVKLYKANGRTSVYINLVYTAGGPFEEDGQFYVALAVFIDALTWVDVKKEAGILVPFTEGRGTLDVLALPEGVRSPHWPVSPDGGDAGGGNGDAGDGWWGEGGGRSPEEILEDIADRAADMEANGHYLKLYHLPAGTFPQAITNVVISDGVKSVAVPDAKTLPLLSPDGVYSNAYIPLTTPSGGDFTRTGQFIVSFTVQIDALTRIVVSRTHNVILPFSEGKGELDIENLLEEFPDAAEVTPDPETEQSIEDIIAQGSYIRFFNIPRNVSKNSFSNISVFNTQRSVARPADYEAIAVRKGILTSEAFVQIASNKGEPFNESGEFYVSFSVIIDALIQIIVQPSYAALYNFDDGISAVDVQNAPPAPAKPPTVPHCLSLGGLPASTGVTNIMDVLVYNSAGIVAKCPDYTKVYLTPFNGKQTAVIPLVYDNNKSFNGQPFNDNGNFLVSFTVYPDATHVIPVTAENNCLVAFNNGNAYLDVSNVPPVPRTYLTITNLPPHIQKPDILNVFVYNQAGKIARCLDYSLIDVSVANNKAAVKIPLVYTDGALFEETGAYYVTFDLNVDALTRIIIKEEDRVLVSFLNGNGTLNANNLPQALPVPYLTIIGLPVNTAKGNFSEVFVYNAAGKLAKCADYQSIMISKNTTQATAMIPLVYDQNSREFFRDSGQFVVTFTINVDINTVITKIRTDSYAIQFTDGSGDVNLASDYGYFSGGLTNPNDTAAPVIKSGTIFELNGGYVKLTANTPISAASFNFTRVIYVYARKSVGNVYFEYSATTPVWHAVKKGYYNGEQRALYKLLYIKDTVVKYVSKTYIADSFKNFDRYLIDNPALSGATNQVYALNGASNPAPQTYTATAGWYLLQLKGAGGGGGAGIDGGAERNYWGGNGGTGGAIDEIVYLPAGPLTTFTGGGGGAGFGHADSWYNGVGAGGGGSGTFAYSAAGYFLCTGGGGGGGGAAAADATGGTGGGGGAVGSGAGGGGGGADAESASKNRSGTWGGNGGGYQGGAGGLPGMPSILPGILGINEGSGGPGGWGSNPIGGYFVSGDPNYDANNTGGGFYQGPDDGGGWGGYGGTTAIITNSPPNDWLNTNGAGGPGGSAGRSVGNGGGHGGNNRNSNRGGGGAGGGGGGPHSGSSGDGHWGAQGFLSIHKIF